MVRSSGRYGRGSARGWWRALVLLLAWAAISVPARAGDALRAAVNAGRFVLATDEKPSMGQGAWTAEQLRERLAAVADQPLELVYTTLAATSHVKIPVEEDEEDRGLLLAPFPEPASDPVLAYTMGSPRTRGQHELRQALVRWRQARVLKLQLHLGLKPGRDLASLSDSDVESLRADPQFLAILEDVFEPVTVLRPTKESVGTGPACAKLPTLCPVTGSAGAVVSPDGRPVLRRTDTILILEDARMGEKDLPVMQLVTSDLLGTVMGHEACHGMVGDLMGKDALMGFTTSLRPHHTHQVTDRTLALSEGFAEGYEAWVGEGSVRASQDDDPESIINLLWARQGAVRGGRYLQAGYHRFVRTRKQSDIKSGAQFVASEGAVAGVIHQLLTHRRIPEGWQLLLRCLYLDRPRTLVALVSAMAQRAPSAPARAAILRTFLWSTRFTTVSAEAEPLHEDQGDARLARSRFEEHARPLEQAVLAGSLPLDANLGPELWLDGYIMGGSPDRQRARAMFRYDLNAATRQELGRTGLSADAVEQVLAYRTGKGFVAELSELGRALSPADLDLLMECHKRFGRRELDQVAGLLDVE